MNTNVQQLMMQTLSQVYESGTEDEFKALIHDAKQNLKPEAFESLRVMWMEEFLGLNDKNPISYPADEVFDRLLKRYAKDTTK